MNILYTILISGLLTVSGISVQPGTPVLDTLPVTDVSPSGGWYECIVDGHLYRWDDNPHWIVDEEGYYVDTITTENSYVTEYKTEKIKGNHRGHITYRYVDVPVITVNTEEKIESTYVQEEGHWTHFVDMGEIIFN